MKKVFYSCFFALLPFLSEAQCKLGLSTGLTYSYWEWHIKSLDIDLDYLPALDWRAAFFVECPINKLLAVRAEAGIQNKANKSGKLIFPDMVSTARAREHYQYLESSLLLQLSPIKKIRAIYLLGGASGGYLNSAWRKTSGTEGGKKFSSKDVIDVSDANWNRWALAADFGLGGNIPIDTRSSFKVEGRFQYGFLNRSTNDNVDAGVNNLLLNFAYMHRL